MDLQINPARINYTQNASLVSPSAQSSTNFQYFHGTYADDYQVGSPNKDAMYGYQGSDTIIGYNSNDYILGMQGNDALYGGLHNDYVSGGEDDDLVSGNEGDDFVSGNDGDDWVYGGQGNDTLNGGQGNDALYGGNGNDRLFAGVGSDYLDAGSGYNILDGGEGYDAANLNQSFDTFAIQSISNGFFLTNIYTGETNTITNTEELWFTEGHLNSTTLQQYLNPPQQIITHTDIPRTEVARNSNTRLVELPSQHLQTYTDIPINIFNHFYRNDNTYNETGNIITSQSQLNQFWRGLGNTNNAPEVDFEKNLIAFELIDSNNPNTLQGQFSLTESGILFSHYLTTAIAFQPLNTHYSIVVDLIPRDGITLIALDEPHAARPLTG